jgi:hypothetical protein
MSNQSPKQPDETDAFSEISKKAAPGILRQGLHLISKENKWYLLPLLVAFVITGAFVLLGGSGMAPLLYALF